MVKASVIIPAHQEEKYIADTLKSLKHPHIETIVVCNGCKDNTAKVAKKFKAKVLELEKKGVSMARNTGARIAVGGTLIFLDADIKVSSDTIDKIINSSYEIGTCKVKPDVDKVLPKILMKLKNITHHFGFVTGVIFVKKKIFNKVKGFNKDLTKGEDGAFVRRAKKIGKYGVVNTYVYNNMRRFEKKGYGYVMLFWVKEFFKKSKKKYEVIR